MYTYTLSKEDALTLLQYFTANKTNGIRKTSKINLWFAAYFLILALISFYIEQNGFGVLLILLALYYSVLNKLFRKTLYTKSFKKSLDTDLSGMAGSSVQLEITADCLHMTDQAGDYRYKYGSIIMISEIPGHFMIKLNNSNMLIIPKINSSIEEDIRKMISDHQLPNKLQLDWKW